MPTGQEIKDNIQQFIIDPTSPQSVTRANVGGAMQDTVDYVDQEVEASADALLAVVNSAIDTAIPYNSYAVLLTQTGTNPPVATILQNNTGVTITWQYADVGSFIYVASSAVFVTAKTAVIHTINSGGSVPNGKIDSAILLGNTGTLNTYNGTTPTNGVMTNTFFEIRIYN